MTKDKFIAWATGDGAVCFQGENYILVKAPNQNDAAVATREQFESFAPSHAHAYADGPIMRYHVTIGDISEIEPVSAEGN